MWKVEADHSSAPHILHRAVQGLQPRHSHTSVSQGSVVPPPPPPLYRLHHIDIPDNSGSEVTNELSTEIQDETTLNVPEDCEEELEIMPMPLLATL